MFKVTNKAEDTRKFRDSFTGRDIHVEPKATVFTKTPIKSSDIWDVEVTEIEKLKKDKSNEVKEIKPNKQEMVNNDSSSSR